MRELNPKDLVALTKVPLHLLPPIGAILGALACLDGAKKYGPYNWRKTPISLMSYLGTLERHIKKIIDGEDIDSDSGWPHEAHIIATATIIADARECGMLIDDRPPPGPAARLFAAFHEAHKKAPTFDILEDGKLTTIPVTQPAGVQRFWMCPDHGRSEPEVVPCCHLAERIG